MIFKKQPARPISYVPKKNQNQTIMGAWSSEPFGNDTAGDWAFDLEDVDDLSLIEETIQKILDCGNGYLEARDAEEALAAVETIARLKGNFKTKNAYTEDVDAWVAAHPLKPPADLIAKAQKAIDRILSKPSELLELWGESDEFEAWKKQTAELKDRIK